MRNRSTPRPCLAATMFLALALGSPLRGLAEVPPTFADVIVLESRGQLEAALKLAEQLSDGLDGTQAAHVENLRTVQGALARARLLQGASLREEAWQDLEEARKGLGSDLDLYLMLEIQKQRMALAAPDRLEARKRLELVQALVEANQADKALEAVQPLLDLPAVRMGDDDRAKALALKVRAQILKDAPAQPGFLAAIGETLGSAARTVARWLLYFLVLIATYLLFTRIPRLLTKRPGTRVSLDDWTAADDKRELKGRELTGEFASAIRRIETPAANGDSPLLDWDSAELVFGPGSLGEVATLSTYVQETDVEVGPIKFNARQLFLWIASLFRPRFRYALTGALSASGATTLTVERRDADGKPIKGAVFSASAEGDGARAEIVRAVAAQVALFLSDNQAVTDNWRSLEQLLIAEESLGKDVQPQGRKATFAAALEHLESALRHDQANWIARVRLAGVLHHLGRFRSSADQYEYLHSRLMNSRALRGWPHFQGFLVKHPEFPWIVRYNEAVSRCRVGRNRETTKAVKIVRELFGELETRAEGAVPNPSPSAGRRPNLEVLARSLRAECWTRRIEHSRDEEPSDELNKLNRELVREIEDDERWMWSQVPSLERGQLTEYTYAHMVTRNALGRAYYLTGRYRKAEKFLRWAIDFHVDAPNVAAKLNLASVYLRGKRKFSAHWVAEAEPLLKDVIAIDPDNSKAHYLLGRLYADPAVNKLDDAKAQLALAGDDPPSLFDRARIALELDKDVPVGLGLARRSLQLDPETGYRHFFIVATLLRHVEGRGDLGRDDLEFAIDVARDLLKARKKHFRAKAEEALPVFKEQLATMQEPEPRHVEEDPVEPERHEAADEVDDAPDPRSAV